MYSSLAIVLNVHCYRTFLN